MAVGVMGLELMTQTGQGVNNNRKEEFTGTSFTVLFVLHWSTVKPVLTFFH